MFQLLDSDYDGAVGLSDLQRVQERPAAGSRDSSLQELQQRRQNPSESHGWGRLLLDRFLMFRAPEGRRCVGWFRVKGFV